MKIGSTFLPYAVFSILKLNCNARKPAELYDVQQFPNLQYGDEIQSTFITDKTVDFKSGDLFINGSFTPYHTDVSQIRVVMPTERLRGAWGSHTSFIGFAVNCGHISNSRWYKIYQNGVELNPSMNYTRFSMDVGKCSIKDTNYHDDSFMSITNIEIIFKINGQKSKQKISFLKKVPSTDDIYYWVNNMKTIYIPRIPQSLNDTLSE